MSDQIKNENVGEVSSPTPEEKVEATSPAVTEEQTETAAPEEKAEQAPEAEEPSATEEKAEEAPEAEPKNEAAPKRKAPSFAEPKSAPRKEPNFGGADSNSEQAENKPEKKLPTFKTEKDGANKPERKEPVIKPKERKFPVFANEVKQHQDEDEGDDVDFTSDSITMPYSMPATAAAIAVDASDISESKGKKKNKKKKGKGVTAQSAELDSADAGNMDQLTELSAIGAAGAAAGVGYDAATRPYIPSYDKENELLGAKQELSNFAEPEPMPEYNPTDKGSATGSSASAKKDPWVDPGIAEANALLADNRAERKNRKAQKNQPVSESKSSPETKPGQSIDVSENPIDKAESANAQSKSAEPAGKPVDPGIAEAAALLAAAAEERARLKALKIAKRNEKKNKGETPAAVVETAETNAPAKAENAEPAAVVETAKANAPEAKNEAPAKEAAPAAPAEATNTAPAKEAAPAAPAEAANTQSAAPLTKADAPKKVMLLLPEDKLGMGVVAPAGVEVEAYSVDDKKATPIPMQKVDVSDNSYDKKNKKKDQNAELEALAVVYGAEKAKQIAASGKKPAKKDVAHPDAEPYLAPVKASGKEASAPKATSEPSTSSYDAKNQKAQDKKAAKSDKAAQREALAVVYGEDKAKEAEAKNAQSEKSAKAMASAVVYGDSEAYNAPAKAAPAAKTAEPKAKKEFSPEAYNNKQEKNLDKQGAKAEKKAEKEALIAVAAAEKQKAKEDKAAEKAAKTPAVVPVATPVYSDSEAYNAPAKAAPVAKTAEPKAKKEFSPEAYENKQQKKLDKQDAKAEKKAEKEALLAVAAADKQKAKEDKAAEKAAEKAAKAPAPVAAPVYGDSNYEDGYDPSAFEKAPVVTEKDNNKAEKKAAKTEDKNNAATALYESSKDKKQNKAAVAAALIAFYNGNKPVAKKAEKEEPVQVTETVYPDANYDEGYDPNWAANEQAARDAQTAAAKEAERAQRSEAKADAAAKRDAKNQHKYETHEERVIREREERDELLLTYKEEIAREKAAKAAAKVAIGKTAPEAEKTEVVYADYTETFDKEAYEASKKSEADAKANAIAESAANKADKRNASARKAEEKISSAYDSAVGKEVANMEMAAEMLALDKQYTKEEKERADRALAAEKAIAKANKAGKNLTETGEIEYSDYTEQFDETLYNTELQNNKEARAQSELARRNAKEAKHSARQGEYEKKIISEYDVATGAAVAAAEEAAEMLALDKQYTKEEKERAKRAHAAEKAISKAGKKLTETDEIVYPDYEEQFDENLYVSELQDIKEAASNKELEKREHKLAKHNARVLNREEKMIAAYDMATEAAMFAEGQKAEMLALNKQYTKEEKERAERARAADKAIAKAAKTLEPLQENIYPDFTETFDEIQYANDLQKDVDVAIARDLKKHETKIERDIARKNARDDKLIAKYDSTIGKRLTSSAEEKELIALAKSDEKETKQRAKKYKKLLMADMAAAVKADETGSHGVVYPDPEYLPDEFDDKYLEFTAANPGDVIEGKIPRITSVAEIRRAEKEDKQLAMLINKDKKRLKKLRYDIETLDIADKYVEDGSLEMADARTVMKDAKLFDREEKDRRAVKEYEKELEHREMEYFAEDYAIRLRTNKKRLKRAEKYGKFMLEYGSTYDPEWDGDFNNYGLPEVHPYTEGVKLARGKRRRTPKKERLSYFDKKKLSALSREQCNTDNKMIEARVQAEYTALQLEVARVEQEFSGEYRTRKEKHWLRNSREKLKNLRLKIATALKYEKLDNERYYSVVATDFERVELPAKADREELVGMREELMRLLDIRDDINAQLLELYTGKENGMRGSTKGRAKAVLRARKWAHARLTRYYRVLNKHRVTRNEKMRIFDKMDEVVDLKGQLARANYILRKERPVGKVKREYLKERKIAKRDIRILKKSIERSTVRALMKARKREKQERAMVLAYSIFVLLGLFVACMIFMGPTILEATKFLVPENFHKYIDIILKHWPL